MSLDSNLKNRIRSLIAEELDDLIELRHDLHVHPELAFEEVRTSKIVRERLGASEIEFVGDLAGGTGVLGHLPGEADHSIALRADMDALPIHELSGVPWASQTAGRMHACGHDGHTTILLGAARVLARLARENPLPRGVSFVFQPAEEGGAGGRLMCEDGVLDGSRLGTPVSSIFGLHGYVHARAGEVVARVGPMLAAADEIEITIKGVGGHAAMPHICVDPAVCAAGIIQALQSVVSRSVDPLDSAVISITKMTAGDAFNVIPDTVSLGGTVRSLRPETQDLLESRIAETVEGIAAAHGCTAQTNYIRGYPVTMNHPDAVERYERIARDCLGHDVVLPLEAPVMGGEDFSFYGQRVPACFFFLGLLEPGDTHMPGLHNAHFDFNDDALSTGIELFCHLALES
ncbi:MAG TPA: amidohydrolase [Phycisphaerales bacterium]|nr:amidohydrolase [Phycisphaerales bacterium]